MSVLWRSIHFDQQYLSTNEQSAVTICPCDILTLTWSSPGVFHPPGFEEDILSHVTWSPPSSKCPVSPTCPTLMQNGDIWSPATWILQRCLGLVGKGWTKCHSCACTSQRSIQHSTRYNTAHCTTWRTVQHGTLYTWLFLDCSTALDSANTVYIHKQVHLGGGGGKVEVYFVNQHDANGNNFWDWKKKNMLGLYKINSFQTKVYLICVYNTKRTVRCTVPRVLYGTGAAVTVDTHGWIHYGGQWEGWSLCCYPTDGSEKLLKLKKNMLVLNQINGFESVFPSNQSFLIFMSIHLFLEGCEHPRTQHNISNGEGILAGGHPFFWRPETWLD